MIGEEITDEVIVLDDLDENTVCFSEFTYDSFEDPGCLIDISTDEIRECKETISSNIKQPAMIPVRFLNVERNIKLLSECRPLCVRLIDCKKFPNFYKENERLKRFNNSINEKNEELSSEEIIFIDEYIPKEKIENMERSDEKCINNPENFTKYTITQNNTEDDEKNIVLNEVSKNELYGKTTSETVHNLDTYARIIEKAHQKLQTLVKSHANVINNNDMSQPDNENTNVNDNSRKSEQSNSIENVVNNALEMALERSTSRTSLSFSENQNIKPRIVKEAHITKNNDQITDSRTEPKRAMTDNEKRLIENKNLNGSSSPILPCPLKPNNQSVEIISNNSIASRQPHKNSDTICTKKIFSDKRVIPHYHEVTLGNHVNSTHTKNLGQNKKKEYATCRINNFTNDKPSPSVCSSNKCEISRNNFNNNGRVNSIPILNSSTTLPCCFSHAIISRQDVNCHAKANDDELLTQKNINAKQVIINRNLKYIPIQPIISSQPPNHYYNSIPQSSIKSSVEQLSNNLPFPNSNSGAKFQTPATNTHTIKPLHSNMLPQYIQSKAINFNSTEEIVSENSKTLPITNNAVETRSTVQRNKSQNISNLIYVPNTNAESEAAQKISVDSKNENISKRYMHLIRALERPIQMNTDITNIQNQRQRTHTNNQVSDFSRQTNSANVGYSPPILPIPTYEKTFEVISKIQYNYFKSKGNQNLNFLQTLKTNPKKRKMNDDKEVNVHQ